MSSFCFTTMLQMRQASAYSPYSEKDRDDLENIKRTCGLRGPTDLHDSLFLEEPVPTPICLSNVTYTIQAGDTCDSIALKHQVASAAVQIGNPMLIYNCSELVVGRELCLPMNCDRQYMLQDNDTCYSIERAQSLSGMATSENTTPGSTPNAATFNPLAGSTAASSVFPRREGCTMTLEPV